MQILKISFISFWEGFIILDNFISRMIKNYEIIENYYEADIVFVGSFVSENEINIIKNIQCKKILFLTEPIEILCKSTYKLFVENHFDIVFGSISNNLELKYIKYPPYVFYFDINDPNRFNYHNRIVKTKNLCNLEFACLINRHDMGNTRTPIYNKLKDIGHISCPSILFNNCSNSELETYGNVKYIQKYIFSICPENFKVTLKGYITEKLIYACLGGAIPIYFGSFDEIDDRFFNKNRIIFYNPFDEVSLQKTYNFVSDLMQNKEKLLDFYQQDIFQENAFEVLKDMNFRLIEVLNNFL